MVNNSVKHSHAQPETVANCRDAGLQTIMSTVRLFANKYIALNRE